LNEWKQALSLVNVNAIRRYVLFFVHDRPVVKIQFSVCLEPVSLDLFQSLGEVFSLLNHQFKIAVIVDAELATNHAKRVSAGRDKRHLITVTPSPA
jgi:hypothetical protein